MCASRTYIRVINDPQDRLDESEFIISAPENSRVAHNPVYFFGKLKVDSLEWLTPEGKKWLEVDLRRRDEDLHLHGEASGLTLARLYGTLKNEGSRITIWIGCQKSMFVRFLGNGHQTVQFLND